MSSRHWMHKKQTRIVLFSLISGTAKRESNSIPLFIKMVYYFNKGPKFHSILFDNSNNKNDNKTVATGTLLAQYAEIMIFFSFVLRLFIQGHLRVVVRTASAKQCKKSYAKFYDSWNNTKILNKTWNDDMGRGRSKGREREREQPNLLFSYLFA